MEAKCYTKSREEFDIPMSVKLGDGFVITLISTLVYLALGTRSLVRLRRGRRRVVPDIPVGLYRPNREVHWISSLSFVDAGTLCAGFGR